MIITSRFPKNLVWVRLIDLNRRSTNFNILFLINEILSYLLTKLSNHSRLSDGKSLQLSGIEKVEWIVVLSMLNVVFIVYAMTKVFFFKGSKWGCLL